jgi:RNA-dependent RNA polymerase
MDIILELISQMLGAGCQYGEDTSKRHKNGESTGDGISYLAFDFTMEYLVVRAKLMLIAEAIPPALRPLDAEISFDDITAGGISIVEERKPGQSGWEVTVTVSCKRPPRFYTEFENSHELQHARFENRRRATAMDFALTNLVSRARLQSAN